MFDSFAVQQASGRTGNGCRLERFTFEKGENARRRHNAARPEVSGKIAFFPRNDRPYGLKRAAFQTEIALEEARRSLHVSLSSGL
ncbi:MAG: hypothetical protein MSH25_07470 [Desulfovibrio sp.]|uniref:hypothetical protein n=1 Tax=Desulfovibrio sp. TaxID=885 RepID=UPI0025BB0C1E|nr:hypothetical protein [Desulfovibrio sp.]MCI7569182.1 hypothetical protein [Desulfovibrio sp.]